MATHTSLSQLTAQKGGTAPRLTNPSKCLAQGWIRAPWELVLVSVNKGHGLPKLTQQKLTN